MTLTPEPQPTNVVCSACGLPWAKHLTGPRKQKPTLEDCVRVLKAELASRPSRMPYVQWSGAGNALPANAAIPLHGNTFGQIS
jgi:hypothetical protein